MAKRTKQIIFHRRMTGPRKSRVKHIGYAPIVVFVVIVVVSAILGLWVEGHL